MKRVVLIWVLFLAAVGRLAAQPEPLVLHRDAGSITFAVDKVDLPSNHLYTEKSAIKLAESLHGADDNTYLYWSNWKPDILACSFADETNLCDIGEDVVFQMLVRAWSQHRPVVLSPDVIWMIICQQFSQYVNENPEEVLHLLVNHEGKQVLAVTRYEPPSSLADWGSVIDEFTGGIAKYSNNDVAGTLVADFSTTGRDERIASEVTLMDVVKPYFEYELIIAICGIPSITLTGTPEDWQKVVDKAKALEVFGLGWWVEELVPILEEFVKASEGNPDYWFWKDIVKKSRPRKIQGPSCGRSSKPLTKLDGWFLKLFPFDNDGRTPSEVTVSKTMLAETVAVPFRYKEVTIDGVVLSDTAMELVAGIVGVQEDTVTFALTPKIGWFVRTVKPEAVSEMDLQRRDSIVRLYSAERYGRDKKYWSDGPLTLDDFSSSTLYLPRISDLYFSFEADEETRRFGNTDVLFPIFRTKMNTFASWIHPDYRNDNLLRYQQTCFDYAELFKRQAWNAYSRGEWCYPLEAISPYKEKAKAFIAKIEEETDGGRDSLAVAQYSQAVREELAGISDEPPMDLHVHPKGVLFAISGGLGTEVYMGSTSLYIPPIVGFNLGFDIGYNNFLLYLDMMYGNGKGYRQDIIFDGYQWDAGEKCFGGYVQASLGYAVYQDLHYKITPFAGVGYGALSYPGDPSGKGKTNDSVGAMRYQAGICFDRKEIRFLNMSSTTFPGVHELTELSLRAKLFLAYTDFLVPGPAWSLNLSLSGYIGGWYLKR